MSTTISTNDLTSADLVALGTVASSLQHDGEALASDNWHELAMHLFEASAFLKNLAHKLTAKEA